MGRRLAAEKLSARSIACGVTPREARQSRHQSNLGEPSMLISVVNRSTKVSDVELQAAVRAINRQLQEYFFPHWQFGARLRVDGAGRVPTQRERKVDLPVLPGRRGDAVIYVVDKATIAGAE